MSEDNATDIVTKLYNGFLLRDILGYMVPGSFVLFCLAHLTSTLTGMKFEKLIQLATTNIFMYVFMFGLSYACGHFLSGIFFHSPMFRMIFTYAPRRLRTDYPSMAADEAWITHRSNYRKACAVVAQSIQGQIERHAALVHFTGHFSAGLLFSIMYIGFLSLYHHSWSDLRYSAPVAVIFPGVFLHYRRLVSERYLFERSAVLSAGFTHGVPKPLSSPVLP